ncbi:hypothetical protein EDB84DRAFT_548882 [Lactarius hengduanensis]|nr:hypothetical protein EDB84DRAFT_548882 [Lactarius hengduanensis]
MATFFALIYAYMCSSPTILFYLIFSPLRRQDSQSPSSYPISDSEPRTYQCGGRYPFRSRDSLVVGCSRTSGTKAMALQVSFLVFRVHYSPFPTPDCYTFTGYTLVGTCASCHSISTSIELAAISASRMYDTIPLVCLLASSRGWRRVIKSWGRVKDKKRSAAPRTYTF